ncbi:MAG: flagellar biosynthesis anti-sigma factor FlgM [Gammaproteobacteria bacterium]|nr:flagellar biosynthesis anti-sigma factor FlgM [Gammaproteobacteria bacterium]
MSDMRTRSTLPPDGIKGKKSSSVTAIPMVSSRRNKVASQTGESSVNTDELLEQLEKLTARISQLPEIDAARIVELHDRISRGEYKINSESLAKKILQLEADIWPNNPGSN